MEDEMPRKVLAMGLNRRWKIGGQKPQWAWRQAGESSRQIGGQVSIISSTSRDDNDDYVDDDDDRTIKLCSMNNLSKNIFSYEYFIFIK